MWQEFLAENKGKNYSMKELSEMYKKKKSVEAHEQYGLTNEQSRMRIKEKYGLTDEPSRMRIKEKYGLTDEQLRMRIKEKYGLTDNYCDRLGGLLNELSSCYLDSTLVSLFFKDNDYIRDNILEVDLKEMQITLNKETPREKTIKLVSLPPLYAITRSIQNDLKVLKQSIHEGKVIVCRPLREHLQTYQKIYETKVGKITQIDWIGAEQEPLDVMVRLATIFHFPDPAIISFSSFGTNAKTGSDKNELVLVTHEKRTASFKILIDVFEISEISGTSIIPRPGTMNLDQFISQTKIIDLEPGNYFVSKDKNRVFSRRIEDIVFIDSPLLYIHIGRVADNSLIGGHGTTKIMTKIIPSEKIRLGNGKNLELSSIIVHHGSQEGGHYTCYLNCLGLWYSYNDVGYVQLDRVGDFQQLLKNEANYILSNATDYFYM